MKFFKGSMDGIQLYKRTSVCAGVSTALLILAIVTEALVLGTDLMGLGFLWLPILLTVLSLAVFAYGIYLSLQFGKEFRSLDRKVVNGDAFLTHAGEILGRMALNDFTVKMNDDESNKVTNELAVSINTLRQNLMETERVFGMLAAGDLSMLGELEAKGKKCDHDNLTPAIVYSMKELQNLVNIAGVFVDDCTQGILDKSGDPEKFRGGFRTVVEGLNRAMRGMEAPIEECSNTLSALAGGNLTVRMTGNYQGRYELMKKNLNRSLDALTNMMNDLNSASSQVASGSRQVSDGSQALSQGATEQSAVIEQLTASITEIAAQTKQNAANALKAREIAEHTMKQAESGNEQMQQMLGSMQEINEASNDTYKIIKVIDDIAFQTNILALNAAVEAARAGQAGKGFAVVAEEVRNLAARSAEAAKNTAERIEGTIGKVEIGSKIADSNAAELQKIVKAVQSTVELVQSIAEASNQQSTGIAQIDQGITQVSTVMQQNSATAEQSAAASEELSSQAAMLRDMVNKYEFLRENAAAQESARLEAAAQRAPAVPRETAPRRIDLGAEEYGKYSR